uniref:Uncharacterized protein n=1 Tax=viral metagenome TaxID=1070528 RepID=A0A6M3M3U4_9ZZZZ
MAHGTPDWVRMVQVAVTVNNVPVVSEPATECAAGGAGNYSGSSTSYQTVKTWTVAAGKVGELKEILIISDDYAHTVCKVTVGSVVWAIDWSPTAAMPIVFEDLKLAAATVVKVEAKSDDGTAIDVDAIIVGKEIG